MAQVLLSARRVVVIRADDRFVPTVTGDNTQALEAVTEKEADTCVCVWPPPLLIGRNLNGFATTVDRLSAIGSLTPIFYDGARGPYECAVNGTVIFRRFSNNLWSKERQ